MSPLVIGLLVWAIAAAILIGFVAGAGESNTRDRS